MRIFEHVFLVKTPFQLLCAQEAQAHFACTQALLLIVEQKNAQSTQLMSRVLKQAQWQKVAYLPNKRRTQVFAKLCLNLKREHKITSLFIADYSYSGAAILMNNLSYSRLVLLDDGTKTLIDYRDYIQPQRMLAHAKWASNLYLRLCGLKSIACVNVQQKLQLFTIYSINDPVVPLERNSMPLLRAQVSQAVHCDPSAPIAFIGEGWVGQNLSLNIYLEQLRRIHAHYARPLVYFPHRYESVKVAKAVKALSFVHYHKSSLPIELELAEQGYRLSGIYGGVSSALYSLRLLYPHLPVHALTLARQGKNYAFVQQFLSNALDPSPL